MAMLFTLMPTGLWVLSLLGIAFGIMFRIFAVRVLFIFIICMIFLPVVWPLACGLIGDILHILSFSYSTN